MSQSYIDCLVLVENELGIVLLNKTFFKKIINLSSKGIGEVVITSPKVWPF